jgi:hypothetical protein
MKNDLPVIEVRFPPTYAWIAIGFSGIFFVLGLVFALLDRRNLGVSVLISTASLAGLVGATYWLQHLHVVARLTPTQLVLRRDGTVNWADIAEIKLVEIRASYRGTPTRAELVCIKLKTPPPRKAGLEGFMARARHAVTGVDIIVPGNELSCPTAWFLAECQKRMAAAGAPGAGDAPPQSDYSAAA